MKLTDSAVLNTLFKNKPALDYSGVGNFYFKWVIDRIEKFYYSDYYESRLKLEPILIDTIQGLISNLLNSFSIGLFSNTRSHAVYKDGAIGLNVLSCENPELLIVHEFGHYMYENCPIVVDYNKDIIKPELFLENEKDLIYFSNVNELRLRLITILYSRFYKLNLEDDIYLLYSNELIEKWLKYVA